MEHRTTLSKLRRNQVPNASRGGQGMRKSELIMHAKYAAIFCLSHLHSIGEVYGVRFTATQNCATHQRLVPASGTGGTKCGHTPPSTWAWYCNSIDTTVRVNKLHCSTIHIIIDHATRFYCEYFTRDFIRGQNKPLGHLDGPNEPRTRLFPDVSAVMDALRDIL